MDAREGGGRAGVVPAIPATQVVEQHLHGIGVEIGSQDIPNQTGLTQQSREGRADSAEGVADPNRSA